MVLFLSKPGRWLGAAFLALGLFCIGCSSNKPGEDTSTDSEVNLYKIGRAYMIAAGELKHPPKNATEMLPYLDPGDTESILKSPDDGQDYVIIWGVDVDALEPRDEDDPLLRFPVLAYEKTGHEGQHLVLQMPSRVVSMTDEQLRKAYFAPVPKPKGQK